MLEFPAEKRKRLYSLTYEQRLLVNRILRKFPDTLNQGIIKGFLDGDIDKNKFLEDLVLFKDDFKLSEDDIEKLKKREEDVNDYVRMSKEIFDMGELSPSEEQLRKVVLFLKKYPIGEITEFLTRKFGNVIRHDIKAVEVGDKVVLANNAIIDKKDYIKETKMEAIMRLADLMSDERVVKCILRFDGTGNCAGDIASRLTTIAFVKGKNALMHAVEIMSDEAVIRYVFKFQEKFRITDRICSILFWMPVKEVVVATAKCLMEFENIKLVENIADDLSNIAERDSTFQGGRTDRIMEAIKRVSELKDNPG